MQKDYEIRVYSLSGAFIMTVPRETRKSEIGFTLGINSGAGELNVTIDAPFSYNTIQKNNVIRVYEFDDENTGGRNIYTGIVQRITREVKGNQQTVKLTALGIQVIYGNLYYKNPGYAYTLTGEPKTLIQNIVTFFNSVYTGAWITYDAGSMDTFGSSISIDVSYGYCMNVIKKIVEAIGWYFYIDGSGKLFFKPKPTTSNIRLTLEDDIDEITTLEDSERVINRHILKYKLSTIVTDDVVSQSIYGIREFYEEKTDIADGPTATAYSNAFLQRNSVPTRKTSIVINSSADLESIKPGDALKVLNLDYTLSELVVQKVTYAPLKATLELESITNFIQELNS